MPGGAVGEGTQHQVLLAPPINQPGALDVWLPVGEGIRLQTHPAFLSYFDPVSGQSALLAEAADVPGELTGPSQVLFRDVFQEDGFQADVRITYLLGGIETDVILRTAPPSPQEWGFDPAHCRLEVWTTLTDPPEPIKEITYLHREEDPLVRQWMAEPDFIDETLLFGSWRIGPGVGFLLDEESPEVPVGKRWTRIEELDWLIEAVDYAAIAPWLEGLPVAAVEGFKLPGPFQVALPGETFPSRAHLARQWKGPNQGREPGAPSPLLLAMGPRIEEPGVVLDWLLLNSATDFTFQGDTTYFVSGMVTHSGTTVLEGGSVVKFTNVVASSSPRLAFSGAIDCQTEAYRPITFTAMDDDTIGESISGSSGTPSGAYAARALQLSPGGTPFNLSHLRVRHALDAIYVGVGSVDLTLSHSQFGFGGRGIASLSTSPFRLRNVLVHDTTNGLFASSSSVTNCNDTAGGYCVDRLRAGDWMHYTIDVRVGQTYAIEARAAGLGTGGVFRVEFYTNGVKYTNTPDLTLTTTNWADVAHHRLSLQAGTNVMRLRMVSDSAEGYAGRFNYLSIYPSWDASIPNLSTNIDVTGLDTNQTWVAATNNAVQIQRALNNLATNGTVSIPAGNYLVAQPVTQEDKDAEFNTAVFVYKSNVQIQGAGKTNTALIGFNRATTVFYMGKVDTVEELPVTNVWLSSLSLIGRPHWVSVTNTDVTSSDRYTNYWERGGLKAANILFVLGSLVLCQGNSADPKRYSENIVLTNCLFQNPAFDGVVVPGVVTNVLVTDCDFLFRADGTNGLYTGEITNPNDTNTAAYPSGGVGFFAQASGLNNCVFVNNTFDGNPSVTNINTEYAFDAGDGIFWHQAGGNVWVARNTVHNYMLEGVHFNAGPAAAAGNVLTSFASLFSTAAFTAYAGNEATLTGSSLDHSYALVGNVVNGGRHGQLGLYGGDPPNVTPYVLHFAGNLVSVHPPFDETTDHPGAMVTGREMEFLNASGNALVEAGHGIRWLADGTNAVVLKNDFGAATHRALTFEGDPGGVSSMSILKNNLGAGISFHLKLHEPDSPRIFLQRNTYSIGSLNGAPFLDPKDAAVHWVY